MMRDSRPLPPPHKLSYQCPPCPQGMSPSLQDTYTVSGVLCCMIVITKTQTLDLAENGRTLRNLFRAKIVCSLKCLTGNFPIKNSASRTN